MNNSWLVIGILVLFNAGEALILEGRAASPAFKDNDRQIKNQVISNMSFVIDFELTHYDFPSNALALYKAKAEAGDSVAQYFVGKALLFGIGCDRNADEGFSWTKKSADAGFAPGINLLGTCYSIGNGVKYNHHVAFDMFSRAVRMGSLKGKVNLAHCYIKGEGVTENVAKGMSMIREAAESGLPSAILEIGDRYEERHEKLFFSGDHKKDREWFRRVIIEAMLKKLYKQGKSQRGVGDGESDQLVSFCGIKFGGKLSTSFALGNQRSKDGRFLTKDVVLERPFLGMDHVTVFASVKTHRICAIRLQWNSKGVEEDEVPEGSAVIGAVCRRYNLMADQKAPDCFRQGFMDLYWAIYKVGGGEVIVDWVQPDKVKKPTQMHLEARRDEFMLLAETEYEQESGGDGSFIL